MGPHLTACDAAGTRYRFCMPVELLPEDWVLRTADGEELALARVHEVDGAIHACFDVDRRRALQLASDLGLPIVERREPLVRAAASWRASSAVYHVGEPVRVELELANTGTRSFTVPAEREPCDPRLPVLREFDCDVWRGGQLLPGLPPWRGGGSVLLLPVVADHPLSLSYCVSRRFALDMPGDYVIDARYRLRLVFDDSVPVPPDACPAAWREHDEELRCTLFVRVVP